MNNSTDKPVFPSTLIEAVRQLINTAKQNIASSINSQLTELYWKIGHRINTEILESKRAEYGKTIITDLAKQLTREYGRSFEEKNL